MKNLDEYINEIISNVKNLGYTEDKVQEIEQRIQKRYNIDNIVDHKHWKYLRETYLPNVNCENIRFYDLFHGKVAMCIKNSDLSYDVAFSFIHPKDYDSDNCNPNFSSYCIRNYVKGKYTYKNINATSSINAVCLANNTKLKEFPKNKQYKIVPYLDFNCSHCSNDCYSDKVIFPDKNEQKNVKKQFQKMIDRPDNVRYYYFGDITALVVKFNNGTYDVVFTICKKDERVSDQYKSKKLGQYYAMKNYINGKYKYHCTDTNNSMSTVVREFNLHKNEFPYQYRNCRLTIDVDCIFGD